MSDRGARRSLHGVVDPPAELRVLGVRPCNELALGHLEIAEDDGEKVVEVVRDSPGELADRLHLERLPERLLGREALVHLMIEALRPAQDREQGEKKQ